MKTRADIHCFGSEEIDLLQDCFDTVQKLQKFPPGSDDAEAMARALIVAYQRGVRDRDDLLRLAMTGLSD